MDPNVNPQPNNQAQSGERSRWRALFILAAVFLVIVSYLVFRGNDHQATAISDGRVNINAKGFFPQTIAISQGQTITWVNSDASPHWVFADPYPSGTSLPSLDSVDPLEQNDSYSFTFKNPGIYTYHDQLHPYQFHGTIQVR